MKKQVKLGLILCSLLIGLSISVNAQVTSYSMVPSSGVYTPITGTTLSLTGGNLDDGYYSNIPLGFTFTYLGTPYTTISATTNGWCLMGGPLTVSNLTNDLATNVPRPVIAPLWDDLEVNTGGNVQYTTTGTPGSQIFTLQWTGMEWRYLANVQCISFQVKLYEANSTIQFIYNQEAGTLNTPTASIGITGTGTGAGNFLSLSDATAAPTVSSTVETTTIATKPATGQVYTFLLPPTDASGLTISAPALNACYTATEPVVARVKNTGTAPLDFTANNMTVTVNVTGALVTTLNASVIDNSLNGGVPLAVGDTLFVPMGNINMTTVGTYTFGGTVALTGDMVPGNDAIPSANRIVGVGTASVGNNDICAGDSVDLILTGYGGTIQWQDSIPGGSWNNIPGATTTPYSFAPSDTAFYRAIVCGTMISNTDFINVNFFGPPTTTDTSRCGIGPVDLIADGNGNIFWWTAMSGGSMIGSGDTITVNVSSDTTFYAANGSGTPPTAFLTTLAAGNGFNANMFGITALNTVSIIGFDGHTASTGSTNWSIYYRPDDYLLTPGANTSATGWTLLGTATGVPGMGNGVATPIPVSFNVSIPAGQTYSFYVAETSGAGVNYTNGTTLGAVYSANSEFQFREGHGGDIFNCTNQPRVFNGNIYYGTGCQSLRTALNVDFIPPAPINLTTASTSICDVDTITLTTVSTNLSYSYEYSPSTYLADTTGTSVDGWPQNDITYIVSALDTAGCAITDTISITVAHAPTGVMSMSDDFTCFGDSVTLNVAAQAGGMFFSSGPLAPISEVIAGGTYDTIAVSGVQSFMGTGDLDSVCINLTHTWDSDLSITLISAEGTMFDLSSGNGGSGDNYTNTCFKMTALTPVTLGTAPFTGPYIPEGTGGFDSFNGENGNGNWILRIVDGASGDVGNLISWNITFAPFNPPVAWTSIPAGLNDTNYTVGVAPTVTTTYIVTITDTTNGCSRNYLDTVTVNPLPVVSLGPDTAICSNYAGIILDGTNPGAGTYLWQDGQTGSTYFASIAGNYSVQVTDTNGCVGSDAVNVGTIEAMVVSIDANLTGIHDADLNAGPGFASYDWSTSATTQVINVNTNGTYFVTCVDPNGCVSTDSLSIVFSLGTFNPNGSETTMQLYPNPSNGEFSLGINNLETTDLMIEVLDMNGKVVHNRVIGEVSGSTIQPFSLTDLRAGAYNLRVMANGKASTIRFIIK